MLLVGSVARNTGKTTFCTEFIRKWAAQHDIVGIKVTTIYGEKGRCHHGDEGCGVCTDFVGDFEIVEEFDHSGAKDTSGLLKAGASKVYWIKATHHCLAEAFGSLIGLIPGNSVIVCESNALSALLRPAVIVVSSRNDISIEGMKPSAKPMLEKADYIVDVRDQGKMQAALDGIIVESADGGCRLRAAGGRL